MRAVSWGPAFKPLEALDYSLDWAKCQAITGENCHYDSKLSSGASGGSLHGGASFKVEKAHFAAWKKSPEKRKNQVALRAQRLNK